MSRDHDGDGLCSIIAALGDGLCSIIAALGDGLCSIIAALGDGLCSIIAALGDGLCSIIVSLGDGALDAPGETQAAVNAPTAITVDATASRRRKRFLLRMGRFPRAGLGQANVRHLP